MSHVEIWIALVGMAVVTVLTRALFLMAGEHVSVPDRIQRALRYAPAEAQAMVDRGEVFTAKKMLRTLTGKAYKQFVVARPWREGVPGFLRAGFLVAFHFYVWAAFWQLSGAARTPSDDALMRRVGLLVETARLPGRGARRAVRLARSARRR